MSTIREGGQEQEEAILPDQILQQTLAFCNSTPVLATVNSSSCVVHRCLTSTATSHTNSGNISCSEEPSNSALNHNYSIPTSIHGFRPVATLGRGNKGTVVLVIAKQTGAPFALKINSCRESSEVDPNFMVMDQSNVSMQIKTKKNQDINLLLSHVDAGNQNIIDHYNDHPLLPDRDDGNEKEILSLLRAHPFLQTLHGYFESGKHSLLLLDFCSGGDLHNLQHKQPEKRFSETAARFYAAEVLVALEQLHNTGIVYRDLKPENILIQENGHIKLTDFDLSLKLVRSRSNGGALMPDKASGTASTLLLKKEKINQPFHEHQVNDSNAGKENVVLDQELAIVKGLMTQDVVKDMTCMRRLGGCFLFEQGQYRGGGGEEDDDDEEKGETADDEVVEAEKFCESKLMEARRIRRRGGVLRRDVQNKKEGINIRKTMAENKKKKMQQKSVCFVGTDEYVAPEVLRGGDHTAAMDWWSYGVLLYEMIYGNTPFRGKNSDETLHNIMEKEVEFPGIVSAAKNLISQLLVKEASKRPRVEEIKRHEFFRGLQWELLTEVARPPFIPPPYSLSEFEDRARRNQQLIRFNPNNSMSRSSSSSNSSNHQNNAVPWIDEVALMHRGRICNSSSSAAASHNLSASTHTQSSASSALSLSSCGAMEYFMNSLHREESLEYMSISHDQDPWTGDQLDLINQQKALWNAC